MTGKSAVLLNDLKSASFFVKRDAGRKCLMAVTGAKIVHFRKSVLKDGMEIANNSHNGEMCQPPHRLVSGEKSVTLHRFS